MPHLARSALAFCLLLPACAGTRAAAPAAPPAPLAAPALADGVVATPIPVAFHDVRKLADVLEDIFEVRPDRGDVRMILHDERAATLIVFATPAGLAAVRRVLGPSLAPQTAAL